MQNFPKFVAGARGSEQIGSVDRSHEELKRARLREELSKGAADLAAGRSVTLRNDAEIAEFFARL